MQDIYLVVNKITGEILSIYKTNNKECIIIPNGYKIYEVKEKTEKERVSNEAFKYTFDIKKNKLVYNKDKEIQTFITKKNG